ncbi:hypothetical protein FisN_10Hu372 [Fistulifera solaris]|uniref:Saposin B-type domain-containing protein n=1 Tax=Fistulifera solaris TaxID=1519565 RepID=A0A1Z5JQV3_FISSO|nr:hypothetical protein FisN_10Hu372 [Fistulifera solaris]|eukprot:GAX16395.1 hypothetical protein FisN_10Hu372 [Fistulifera solaris]
MKFTLISLLATVASVTAQLEPPEMVVFYVNQQAQDTACTPTEFAYIDSKMVPDLDMALMANNFDPADWEFSTDPSRRKLNPTCDWCRPIFGKAYCNQMFNCGFRRKLRQNPDATRKLDTAELGAEMLQMCQDNIALISTRNRFLSAGCKAALGGSTCHVEFI